VNRDTASAQKRYEDAKCRTIAVMENSILLNNAQRAAQTGPIKDSADKVRSDFSAMAEASVRPYFDPKEDSTTNLADEIAYKLPPQLQSFLPDEQRQRLVNCARSFFSYNLFCFC
jgi:hypothetical protein